MRLGPIPLMAGQPVSGVPHIQFVHQVIAADFGQYTRRGDTPRGCIAAYYPEANPLVPLSLHDQASKTPAYKGVPVWIEA